MGRDRTSDKRPLPESLVRLAERLGRSARDAHKGSLQGHQDCGREHETEHASPSSMNKPTKADLIHEPVPINPPARPPPFGTFDDLTDEELYYHRSREDDVDQELRNAEYKHAKAVYEGEVRDADGQVRVADDGFGSFVKFRSSACLRGAIEAHWHRGERVAPAASAEYRRNNRDRGPTRGLRGRTKPATLDQARPGAGPVRVAEHAVDHAHTSPQVRREKVRAA